VLLGRGDLVAALPREVEGDARDALDLAGRVDLRVDAALLAVVEGDDLLRLAEVNAARELAYDDDVEPLDHLALQRRRVGQGRVADRGPEIGKQPEILAQAQQPRLGPMLVRNVGPLRSADRAEQHRVRRLRALHRRFADGDLVGVERRAADEVRLDLEPGDALPPQPVDQLLDLARDLGPMPSPGRRRIL
jgi:hypothetical protein